MIAGMTGASNNRRDAQTLIPRSPPNYLPKGSCTNNRRKSSTVDHIATSRRCDRSTYVPPGVGSVRPPRASSLPWDSTGVPDGLATVRLRAYATDGTLKDALVTLNVQNQGSEPNYAEFLSPKNGDTVSGWVGLAFTAMPQRLGIVYWDKDTTKWGAFLPTCFDIDINYWKIEYAQGLSPNDSGYNLAQSGSPTEYKVWAFSDYNYIGLRRNDPKDGVDTVSPAGCPSAPVFTYSATDKSFQTQWNSTVVPDGPATIRFTNVPDWPASRSFGEVLLVPTSRIFPWGSSPTTTMETFRRTSREGMFTVP